LSVTTPLKIWPLLRWEISRILIRLSILLTRASLAWLGGYDGGSSKSSTNSDYSDNGALLCVGDSDDVHRPQAVPLPPPPPIPSHNEPRVAVFTDPEVTSASVVIDCKYPTTTLHTLNDYRRDLIKGKESLVFHHNGARRRRRK